MNAIVRLATCGLAAAAGMGILNASGPIAVYALVERVVFEPNPETPERIQVFGIFITAAERSNSYSDPQRGYLYFTVPANSRELALREWADLKSVAGTHQVVAFGSSWSGKVRVRKADEEAKSPDAYVMGNGLVKVNADHPMARALLDSAGH